MKTESDNTFKDEQNRKIRVIVATNQEGERFYMHNSGGMGWDIYKSNHLGMEVKHGFSNSKASSGAVEVMERLV